MKNTITWILKIFLIFSSLMLLYAGFMWSFLPQANLTQYSIETTNILGMNMIKTDIGAPLLAVGIMLLLFAIKDNKWFMPLAIFTSAYVFVRTISLIVDGSAPMIIFGIAFEVVVLAAIFGLNYLRTNKGNI